LLDDREDRCTIDRRERDALDTEGSHERASRFAISDGKRR